MMNTVAEVKLWGKTIAAVGWDDKLQCANFEYEPAFVKSHIQVSPLMMPLSKEIYNFPNLNRETFKGLPGLLADSLPDKFGNALIDQWLASKGRTKESFNPVERLCYIGTRGMGALEYFPAEKLSGKKIDKLDIADLVQLASDILRHRTHLSTSLSEHDNAQAMRQILQVGTSAGGARAKAIIAWNEKTNEIVSGQIKKDSDFTYWIMKFDGVQGNKDKELEDPQGYGLIEYAYYQMAIAAGIEMSQSKIFSENNRHHFMTQRFDRSEAGEKIHMLSLGGMQHYDFNIPGAYSYEQALQTIKSLGLPMEALEEQYRRMIFNVIARNQDDHVKNIAFLMDKQGNWSLSPAYDMTYSYNPEGLWTNKHQISINGKQDQFELEDVIQCAKTLSMRKNKALEIIQQVQSVIAQWSNYAQDVGIAENVIESIAVTHRKLLN